MASLPGEGSPPMSIRHGIRVVTDPQYTVEQVLLAVGEQVGHENIKYGSRMNKAVVAFLREERLVHELVESGLVLDDLFVSVSPLFVPSTRVTVSGVPPFIPNELLERELVRFGKFSSGLKTVRLGCKDVRLQHVQSLRRQAFMYLNDPAQFLEVSFKVKYEQGYYTVYASAGSMRCFDCGDVGHKRSSCPHKEQATGSTRSTGEQHNADERQAPGEQNSKKRAADDLQTAGEKQATGKKRAVFAQSATGENQTEGKQVEGSAVNNEPHVVQSEMGETSYSVLYPDTDTKKKSKNSEVTNQKSDNTEEQLSTTKNEGSGQTGVVGDTQSVEAESGAADELLVDNVEMEDEDMEDDSLSQYSDIVSQDDKQLYSLEEVNQFLDETYGKHSVDLTKFFPDTDRFINSVLKISKQVGYEQLSKPKRYRLKKILTKLRKIKRGKTLLKVYKKWV